jgi:N-acetylated-alpha-linked acidic dipeptidase
MAGSAGDRATALRTRDLFAQYGFDAEIQPIQVLLPAFAEGENATSLNRSVTLEEGPGAPFRASLVEPPIPGIPSTFRPAPPIWGGWSHAGNVSGPLVYANFGREEDFVVLEALGLNLTGTIVIARYGSLFRGDILHGATRRGAVGLLVYTDPSDYGYMRGAPFPAGPWATNATAQRGTFWRGNASFQKTLPSWAGQR